MFTLEIYTFDESREGYSWLIISEQITSASSYEKNFLMVNKYILGEYSVIITSAFRLSILITPINFKAMLKFAFKCSFFICDVI